MKQTVIVRDEKYAVKNGDLYLIGSSSHELYKNNMYQMGSIKVLGWLVADSDLDFNNLTKLESDPRLEVALYPAESSIFEKIKIIKNEVRKADCLSLKLFFIDSAIACYFAKKYKKEYVIESGVDVFQSLWYHGGSIKYKLAALPLMMLSKYYHRTAKNIIYVSKQYLQKRYPSRANQIGCPDTAIEHVDISILRERLHRIDTREIITLGLIGASNVWYRGHDILIKVAAELVKEGYLINVRFLGNDNGKEKLLKYAKELNIRQYVIFDGYKTKQYVYEWIDEIDILVMPTLAETLGRSIIEAMSRGCPVIGSLETAIPEQVGSDCIAPARDYRKIESIIKRMIDDRRYMTLCAYENYYRAQKYESQFVNKIRKSFYDSFMKSANGWDANDA